MNILLVCALPAQERSKEVAMGKVDEDPHVHGMVGGLIAFGVAWVAWQCNHPFVSVIAGIIGAFLFIGGLVMAVKEDS